MIVEAIRRHLSVQLRLLDRPICRKPYLEWIEKTMPLSSEFKVLDFNILSSKDEKSTIEHISQFTTHCGKANQNEDYKLQLFPLSLTAVAFT